MKNFIIVLLVLSAFSMSLIQGKALRSKSASKTEISMDISAEMAAEIGMEAQANGDIQWFSSSNQKCIDDCIRQGYYVLTPSQSWWACGLINTYIVKGTYSYGFVYKYQSVNC